MEYSIVVAVDRKTVKDLRQVWPTWKKLKPQLWQAPLKIIYDAQAGNHDYWQEQLRFAAHPDRELVGWAWPESDDSELSGMDQRERMLTAFVKVPPAVVTTAYWLKIDCDVVAFAPGDFVWPSWDNGHPSIIAPSWRYTKPAGLLHDLDRWAATVPHLAGLRAMNPPPLRRGQETISMPFRRICSWFAFFSTAFSKQVCDYCPGRLPVPSQDTLHWYVAWRQQEYIIQHNPKKNGWQTVSGFRRRQKVVDEVLAQYAHKQEGCCG